MDYTITVEEAENLLDWIGNNFIETDLTVYDGAEEMISLSTARTAFGFRGDSISVTPKEVAEAVVQGAEILYTMNKGGTFTKAVMADKERALKTIEANVDFGEEWKGLVVALWNVELI